MSEYFVSMETILLVDDGTGRLDGFASREAVRYPVESLYGGPCPPIHPANHLEYSTTRLMPASLLASRKSGRKGLSSACIDRAWPRPP